MEAHRVPLSSTSNLRIVLFNPLLFVFHSCLLHLLPFYSSSRLCFITDFAFSLSLRHGYLTNRRTRADLARDACPAGYYCPDGVSSPISCPNGTYNPHTGRDDFGDCIISPEGYYTEEASTSMTGRCEAGHYCPAGSIGPQQVRQACWLQKRWVRCIWWTM